MKIRFIPCFSLNLSSVALCAEPSIVKFFLQFLKLFRFRLLLNVGMYTPSKFAWSANFILFAK